MEHSALTEAVQQVLSEHGPLEVPELVRRLAGQGLSVDEAAIDLVLYSEDAGLARLPDERAVNLLSLLDGRVFTHRVSADEVEHDLLHVVPDLIGAVLLEVPAYEHFVDGTPFDPIYPEAAEVDDLYPPGVIAEMGSVPLDDGALRGLGVGEGDLVGLHLTSVGVELTAVTTEAVDPSDHRLVLGVLEAQPDRPMPADQFVLGVLAADDGAFRAAGPPLAELLKSWGVAFDGEFVAVPGFDLGGWWADRQIGALQEAHDLKLDEAMALAALVHLHGDFLDHGGPVEPSREGVAVCTAYLAEPAVAEALLEEATVLVGPSGAAALGTLAESLVGWVERDARPALHWLRGKAHEQLGAMAEAEQSFRTCLRLDPDWWLALVDLARMAGDRGDAATALAFLERAGPDSAPQLQETLERFRPVPGPTLARNAPCWCGSGRKFKQCHLHRSDELPLPRRADWLYRKAGLHLVEPQWMPMLHRLAILRARYADSEEKVREAALDPLLPDVLLFEGGGLEDFVRLRGSLLPADELILAQSWLLTERSVYEVTAVEPGTSLTLRDLRTGEVSVVVEHTASRELEPGWLICTHVLPTGADPVLYGGIEPVGLRERDALLELLDDEPRDREVVGFLTRRFAPVGLTNTEGDPMVLGEAVLRTDDPAALAGLLDAAYERDPDALRWAETVDVQGSNVLRARLWLDGDRLHVEANSDRRLDTVLARVFDLQPGLESVSDERTPIRDTRELAAVARQAPPPADDGPALAEEPEVREAMTAYMADYEARWLDLPVPALGDRTPREVADDPTRREDLVALLAGFPQTDDPTQMSAGRLRAALGLDRD